MSLIKEVEIMSTRGAYGFYYQGINKISYNHCDSYPMGLGIEMFDYIRSHSLESMKKIFKKIKIIDEHNYLCTDEEIQNHHELADLGVSNKDIHNPYVLLRNGQGNLNIYDKEKITLMIDGQKFMGDGSFNEHAYIINLESEKLEYYEGFKKDVSDNRYKQFALESEEYKNVKLVKEFTFNEIWNYSNEKLIEMIPEQEFDDE